MLPRITLSFLWRFWHWWSEHLFLSPRGMEKPEGALTRNGKDWPVLGQGGGLANGCGFTVHLPPKLIFPGKEQSMLEVSFGFLISGNMNPKFLCLGCWLIPYQMSAHTHTSPSQTMYVAKCEQMALCRLLPCFSSGLCESPGEPCQAFSSCGPLWWGHYEWRGPITASPVSISVFWSLSLY